MPCGKRLGDRLIDDGWSPRLAHAAASSAGRRIVARGLIEGQVTFPEAIERFRALSKHNPYYSWGVFNQAFPGATDDECFGRQVIAFVRSESNHPDRIHALVAGLEAQISTSASQTSVSGVQ